jgi:chromosome segregation ATPase
MSKKTQVTNTLKANRDLNAKIAQVDKLENDLQARNNTINEKIAQVNTLEHDLQARNNTIAALNAEIQAREQQSQHQQSQIAQQNHTIATLNAEIQVREQQSQHQQGQITQMIAQRIERQAIIDTLKDLSLMSEFDSMHKAVSHDINTLIDTLKDLRLMSEFDSMHTAVSHAINTLTEYTTMLKDKWSRGIRKLFNEKTQFVTTAVVGSEISIPVAQRINYDIQEEAPNRQIDTAVYRVLSQGFMLGDTIIEKARVTRIDPL